MGEWEERYASSVSSRFNTLATEVGPSPTGPELTFETTVDGTATSEREVFDHVIFVLGFGLEPADGRTGSYWENDALSQNVRPDQCVLIVGYGDGALTDLMRGARLINFDHRRLLAEVIAAISPQDVELIKAIESDDRASDPEFITQKYEQLDMPAVRDLLDPLRNERRRVVLTGRGRSLFDPRSNALNRLIASQLLRLRAYRHEALEPDEKLEVGETTGPVLGRLQDRVGQPFDLVVRRFGVESTIERVQGLTDDIKTLERTWRRVSARTDPTRVPLWQRFSPISDDVDSTALVFLAPVWTSDS